MARFFEAHADLAEEDDFDAEFAGARLLARDIAGIVSAADLRRLLDILAPEIDPDGALILVDQADAADAGRALQVFTALAQELQAQKSLRAPTGPSPS